MLCRVNVWFSCFVYARHLFCFHPCVFSTQRNASNWYILQCPILQLFCAVNLGINLSAGLRHTCYFPVQTWHQVTSPPKATVWLLRRVISFKVMSQNSFLLKNEQYPMLLWILLVKYGITLKLTDKHKFLPRDSKTINWQISAQTAEYVSLANQLKSKQHLAVNLVMSLWKN